MEVVKENCLFPSLDNFGWNAVTAWGFAGCESVDGLAEFIKGGWGVEFVHDWQGCYALSRCVGDNILLRKQLLPVLCPSLHLFSAVCDGLSRG